MSNGPFNVNRGGKSTNLADLAAEVRSNQNHHRAILEDIRQIQSRQAQVTEYQNHLIEQQLELLGTIAERLEDNGQGRDSDATDDSGGPDGSQTRRSDDSAPLPANPPSAFQTPSMDPYAEQRDGKNRTR